MRSLAFTLVLASAVALAPASAQTLLAPQDDSTPSLLAEVPSVPGMGTHGFNAGATITSAHDSSVGWYTLFMTAASYNFNRHFSADLSMPVYFYRLAEIETTTTGPAPAPGQPPPQTTTTTTLQPRTWDPGDLIFAVHAMLNTPRFSETFTPSFTMPSGDSDTGLSTGRVTFDCDNYTQMRLVRGLSGVLDLGAGDSSTLVNRLVTRDYTSLGPLAHFQLGLAAPLALPFIHNSRFESVAYEQLPIGDNKIYTTVTRPGYPARTVVSGRSVSEDNGFTNSLFLPITRHLTLEGYYNRSLRLHLDTAAMGISWALRAPREPKKAQDDGISLLK